MSVLAIDLGGTKLALAVFNCDGKLVYEEKIALHKKCGVALGQLILDQIEKQILVQGESDPIRSIGISVPGIYQIKEGTVWAPNIPGWESYPLLKEVQSVANNVPVIIDSDRSCYIAGEWWQGAAKECTDAVFLAVGTGIGAGILCEGKILRGAKDIAGAVGWMALERPFNDGYIECGCFESTASGEGIVKLLKKMLSQKNDYDGELNSSSSTADVFKAYDNGDVVAKQVVMHCIEVWGMAIANLISLLNPEKIILGGGVFGPAVKFIPAIYDEAKKWAQPVSMQQVTITASALGAFAGVYGAAYLAMQNLNS